MDNTLRPLPLVRNSERLDFKSCPAKWNWRWNLGLVPAHPRQDARWYGSMWHLLWATVYTPPTGADGFTRAIVNPAEIHALWDELAKDAYTTVSSASYFDEDKEKEYWDAIELGHIMIDGQLKRWKLDPGYEVLMPEQRFSMKIPFNNRQKHAGSFVGLDYWTQIGHPRGPHSGGAITQCVGTFDLPIRDHTDGRGTIRILDWKTTNRKDNMKQANKDDQMGLYIAVATIFLRSVGLILKDEAVNGAIWSFAKKAKPPENTDENGTVRNLPKKEHFIAAILSADARKVGVWEEGDLLEMKVSDLKVIADNAELTVYGEPSKRQGSPMFWREIIVRNKHNRLHQLERIADEAEAMAAVRAGVAPLLKTPGEHCNWCDFNDLCDLDEDGGDTATFIRDVFKYEDPYVDHREGAINSKKGLR